MGRDGTLTYESLAMNCTSIPCPDTTKTARTGIDLRSIGTGEL